MVLFGQFILISNENGAIIGPGSWCIVAFVRRDDDSSLRNYLKHLKLANSVLLL